MFRYGSAPAPPVPAVTVTGTPNPAMSHQLLTFRAGVSPTDGGGTVAFSDGASATPLVGCSAVTLARGDATCSTSSVPAGEHTITAACSGDASYAPSTGSTTVAIATLSALGRPVAAQAPGHLRQDHGGPARVGDARRMVGRDADDVCLPMAGVLAPVR